MRILVVEDDPRTLETLTRALEGAGYLVDHTGDGEDAWFRGDTEPYAAVILDLGLKGMDGLAVLKRWRAAGRDLPVLILTARGDWSERVEGIDAGADDYLPKPFRVEEVLARVLKEQGRTFDPTAAAPAPTAALAPAPAQVSTKPPKLGTLQRIRRIEAAIESVRPNLRRDHGDVELVEVDGKNVYVNMTGACAGCQMASVTLEGLQQRIIEELGELIRVLPASAMRQRA